MTSGTTIPSDGLVTIKGAVASAPTARTAGSYPNLHIVRCNTCTEVLAVVRLAADKVTRGAIEIAQERTLDIIE